MLWKIVKIFFGVILVFGITVWMISRKPPIILNLLAGSARNIDKPGVQECGPDVSGQAATKAHRSS